MSQQELSEPQRGHDSQRTGGLGGMWRFFAIFIVIQAVLFSLEMWKPVQENVIQPFTASLATVSSWLMQLFDSDVMAQGVIIWSRETQFAVEIAPGCNGVEVTIIFFAAIMAFPAPWKYKMIGLVAGILAIHLVNLVRIISLFYLGQWNLEAFEWAHLYLWQALILLDAIIVWLIWLRKMPAREVLA